ncbi:MAG TPA: hypothetical protein VGG45_10795 [Terracidiphilus sp.]
MASRPSPSIVGRLYFTTDTQQIFYDTGSAWDNVTPVASSVATAIQQQTYVYAADSGAANALIVSLSPSPTIVAGSLVVVLVAATNTGASTIAVNGGSATAITKDGTTALTGGELTAGQIVFLVYDGTEYQLIGGTGSSSSGTVTSVALTVPARQSVSGSPITSSGTLAITDNNETANEVFAGPSSGSAATPGFRALVPADLPVATTSALGAVKPDGSTITVSAGVISATSSSGKPSVTFSIATGAAASPAAPYVLAPVAGTVSNCYFTTLTSDSGTNLVFNLKKNGTSVLSGSSATVTAGTSGGTVSTFSLTSGTISVSQSDKWELDITTGTSNWTGTVQCY